MPVESPCIRNCCLDDKDVCVGCFRSIDEIMDWAASTDEEKREILRNCEARREDRRVWQASRRNEL